MKRRAIVTGLAVSAGAGLAAGRGAGQERIRSLRVGIVTGNPITSPFWVAFLARLRELGLVQGENLQIEFVDLVAPGRTLEQKIADMLRAQPQVVVASGGEIVLETTIAATKTVPIVMIAVDFDPLARGYVASLARPTSNVTGLFLQPNELSLKRLQLLREVVPNLTRAAVFYDRLSINQWESVRENQARVGVELVGVELRDPPYDYERALAQIPATHRGMLLLMTTPVFFRDRVPLAAMLLRHGIPSVFTFRGWADEGGLMSYGPSIGGMWRRAAEYVERLARGARPAELPIEQPTGYEMVINLRTARALGLDIPLTLLARADEVIE